MPFFRRRETDINALLAIRFFQQITIFIPGYQPVPLFLSPLHNSQPGVFSPFFSTYARK
jgi:hypothetical protein